MAHGVVFQYRQFEKIPLTEGVKCWEYVMNTLFSQLHGGLYSDRIRLY